MNFKIDLFYFPSSNKIFSWPWGQRRELPSDVYHAAFTIKAWLKSTESDYAFFWDFSLGEPDVEAIQLALSQKADVWHAGLLLGMQNKPEWINYIIPTWALNADADPRIASTSWHLSLKATLFKTSILKALNIDPGYMTFDALALDMGFYLIQAGAIMRHFPALLNNRRLEHSTESLPAFDQARFIRRHFDNKWFYWVLYRAYCNQYPIGKLYSAFRKFRSKEKISITPIQRERKSDSLSPAKVSVLAPTLERYPYIRNEIEQLNNQFLKPHEVLITDQTEAQYAQSIDVSSYTDISIKVFPQNELGQCVAWNRLIDEATGDYLLFLGDDADCILPDYIQKMANTAKEFNADMVASEVVEAGIIYGDRKNIPEIKMADGFPYTLIKRETVLQAGCMNMLFNKTIRADHDLFMRCLLSGALMIKDKSIEAWHHRAPSGGLRKHKARVITNAISKNSITKIQLPVMSEYYIAHKYFSQKQAEEAEKIKLLSLFFVNGSTFKKLLRVLYVIINTPSFKRKLRKRKQEALDILYKEQHQDS